MPANHTRTLKFGPRFWPLGKVRVLTTKHKPSIMSTMVYSLHECLLTKHLRHTNAVCTILMPYAPHQCHRCVREVGERAQRIPAFRALVFSSSVRTANFHSRLLSATVAIFLGHFLRCYTPQRLLQLVIENSNCNC